MLNNFPIEYILTAIYILIVVGICIRIISDSRTPSKSLAYLLLIIILPVVGIIFYLSVGLNYRKRKLYNKKIEIDKTTFPELEDKLKEFKTYIDKDFPEEAVHFKSLSQFLFKHHILSGNNKTKLLINGEQKFPDLIQSLKNARDHIHIEYYIYKDDTIGNQIAEILMEKAQSGVKVRLIFDDYGSRSIRKTLIPKLRSAGVEAYPFYKVTWIRLANRMNYRNHRKIIVIDGSISYIGGINIADEYINTPQKKLYWRDTHLKISGPAALNLQYTFLTDWNFCSGQNLAFSLELFPLQNHRKFFGNQNVQILSSGPDSDYPNILFALVQMILLSKKQIAITNPYFIPDKSFLDALKIAALSGIQVRLLTPGISDSWVVNMTSQSYYQELLEAGVEIFLYNKGFVHAKTIVCDACVSMVGTANLDNRSFDLNFETNALVYSSTFANELLEEFENDLKYAQQIHLSDWENRSRFHKLTEKILYLFSSLM